MPIPLVVRRRGSRSVQMKVFKRRYRASRLSRERLGRYPDCECRFSSPPGVLGIGRWQRCRSRPVGILRTGIRTVSLLVTWFPCMREETESVPDPASGWRGRHRPGSVAGRDPDRSTGRFGDRHSSRSGDPRSTDHRSPSDRSGSLNRRLGESARRSGCRGHVRVPGADRRPGSRVD